MPRAIKPETAKAVESFVRLGVANSFANYRTNLVEVPAFASSESCESPEIVTDLAPCFVTDYHILPQRELFYVRLARFWFRDGTQSFRSYADRPSDNPLEFRLQT